MKKVLGILLALSLAIAIAVPVMADIPTDVTVTEGTGDPPIIKCKWETPDDGDPTHSTFGTQILPPLVWETYKTVGYYAVVTDPQGLNNVAAVYADVFHPEVEPWCGSFKYQIELIKVANPTTCVNLFNSAVDQNLVTFNGYTEAEIIHELEQGSAAVFKLVYNEGLWYEQPAGVYNVTIKAVNLQNIASTLDNTFTYVAVSGVEVDFTDFTYGAVIPDVHKQINGDTNFDEAKPKAGYGQANGATVRNIGNTLTKVTILQSDLEDQYGVPLGKTGVEWNVQFDARLGVDGTWAYFPPEEMTTLNDVLELSSWDKLDFSIQIFKFGTQGDWTGDITIGSVIHPFVVCGT